MRRDIILKCEGLKKYYRIGNYDVKALDGVDLDIQSGEFSAVMGPSGCGKSTLLHLLGGLDRPSEGKILIEGVDISCASEAERTRIRRDTIGYVFQRFNLFPTLTARQNLELARDIRGNGHFDHDPIERMLRIVGLDKKGHHKPLELSIGEQQRVAIARALVNYPKILLADEPTGNLDSRNSEQILDLFVDINRKIRQTIIMITHSSEAASYASRLINMKDGRLV
ncbi:ABC transporter ATP-binding protein [Acidobacteriota bacterium]